MAWSVKMADIDPASFAQPPGTPLLPAAPPFAVDGDRIQQENALLRETVAMYGRLSSLTTQDSDLTEVVELIAARLAVPAAVLDVRFTPLASAAPDGVGPVQDALGTESELHRLAKTVERTRRALTVNATSPGASTVVVAPVVIGDELAGYLLTGVPRTDDRTEDLRLLITEHAAMVCSVVLGRARVVAAASGQARRDLFEALLLPDRNASEVENWARHLGIRADSPQRVVALTLALEGPAGPVPAELGTVAAFVEQTLLSRAPEATVIDRGDEVVAVVPDGGTTSLDPLRALLLRTKETTESRFRQVTVSAGIGDCYAGAELIARSYAEARRAVDTSRMLTGLGDVAVFGDLGIHRLLVRVRDVADLREFATDVLGPLLEYERANDAGYVATLTAYFRENNSPQRTAKHLHMHANTVAYRIRRIEEITGMTLSSYADRLVVQVAVEIVNGLGGDLT